MRPQFVLLQERYPPLWSAASPGPENINPHSPPSDTFQFPVDHERQLRRVQSLVFEPQGSPDAVRAALTILASHWWTPENVPRRSQEEGTLSSFEKEDHPTAHLWTDERIAAGCRPRIFPGAVNSFDPLGHIVGLPDGVSLLPGDARLDQDIKNDGSEDLSAGSCPDQAVGGFLQNEHARIFASKLPDKDASPASTAASLSEVDIDSAGDHEQERSHADDHGGKNGNKRVTPPPPHHQLQELLKSCSSNKSFFPTPRFVQLVDCETGLEVQASVDPESYLDSRRERLRQKILAARRQFSRNCEVALELQKLVEKKVRKWIALFEDLPLQEKIDPNTEQIDKLSDAVLQAGDEDQHASSRLLAAAVTPLQWRSASELDAEEDALEISDAAALEALLHAQTGLGGSRFERLSAAERQAYLQQGPSLVRKSRVDWSEALRVVESVLEREMKIMGMNSASGGDDRVASTTAVEDYHHKNMRFCSTVTDDADLQRFTPQQIIFKARLRPVEPVVFADLEAETTDIYFSAASSPPRTLQTWPQAVRTSVRDATFSFLNIELGSDTSFVLGTDKVAATSARTRVLVQESLEQVEEHGSGNATRPEVVTNAAAGLMDGCTTSTSEKVTTDPQLAPPDGSEAANCPMLAANSNLLFWEPGEQFYVVASLLLWSHLCKNYVRDVQPTARQLPLRDIRDATGKNCLDFAVHGGLRDLVEKLLQWPADGEGEAEKTSAFTVEKHHVAMAVSDRILGCEKDGALLMLQLFLKMAAGDEKSESEEVVDHLPEGNRKERGLDEEGAISKKADESEIEVGQKTKTPASIKKKSEPTTVSAKQAQIVQWLQELELEGIQEQQ
ncbi:unnamed protein product [Amoebophrya sp. A120]|nr:unnamed protein product [Amoebophrya sp. A120]|eukprot:GSA120T00016488001.1